MLDKCFRIYIELTAYPDHAKMRMYASMFSKLDYAQQGELSYLIHQHFHGA